MKYAFYISKKATRLSKIIEQRSDFLKDVSVVFSDDKRNEYLKADLKKIGIEYILYDYKEIESHNVTKNEELSNLLLRILETHKVDYCFSFGAHILKGKLLDIYKNRIINFHPSLLPDYPGINSIDQAIDNGTRYIGNTAHFIDSGVDTGPIILQSIQPVEAFYLGGYDAILDVQIEMLYMIDRFIKEERIKIEDTKVKIINANYINHAIFPS